MKNQNEEYYLLKGLKLISIKTGKNPSELIMEGIKELLIKYRVWRIAKEVAISS